MFNYQQFADLILKPTLTDLLMYSDKAMHLMAFTLANESDGGTFLRQIHGPALGIYQMEPKTYTDIWENFIAKKPNIALIMTHQFQAPVMQSEDRLIYDLRYATAMTRLFYYRLYVPLPEIDDMQIWKYYKTYYNTSAGKASEIPAINKYHKFIYG